ncbi:MAG: heterodisulfide reductase-related iron-sulfur binding cluster [Anaerolineaceae bacterium]
MPERVDFWGIPSTWGPPSIYVYVLMGLASVILVFRFYQRARLWWRIGLPEVRWNHFFVRVGRLLKYAIVQTRVLDQRYPGIMHVALAWSFFVFFMGTALATLNSHFFVFLTGNAYLLYKLMLDLFTIFFFIGAGLAAYRRFIVKPPRLTLSPGFTLSLILLVFVVIGGLLTESLRLAITKPVWCIWSPAGCLLAQAWISTGASESTLLNWHLGIWIFHLLLVSVTLITLPVGTLLHILTGPLNVFFSDVDHPFGYLAPIPENKTGEQIFASTLRGLTWKQLLDSDACTECGRCQDVCPAFASGTPLSPKKVIMDIREALKQDGPMAINPSVEIPLLVGTRIKNEELWSCTTCGACMRECPILIEHVNTIVGMRRHLVIEGQMDTELQDALSNLGRYGNSFGQSERMRAKWTQPITPVIKDVRKESVDYLWFVGDYASYNPALTDITVATAEVFQKAGVDFGILYDSERNAGNDVRRAGEEGLYEMLSEKNMAALSKCKFKSIVTTDPHTYNTIKHEYPLDDIGNPPIIHYAELLDQLISSGKLKLTKKLNYRVTYHDPCYLGRYNGIYDIPRRVIQATGCELVEMPRTRDRSYCCGAGGGHIWMAEGKIKERPSESRIKEAATLNDVKYFIVACPKDVTMYRDAVKTTGNDATIAVKDLIELVREAL